MGEGGMYHLLDLIFLLYGAISESHQIHGHSKSVTKHYSAEALDITFFLLPISSRVQYYFL
jgi:hypothetical protein